MKTRKVFSRMRTARLLTVGSMGGWYVYGGVCVKEGCECPGVCVYRGVLGMYTHGPRGRHPPPDQEAGHPFPVNRMTDAE